MKKQNFHTEHKIGITAVICLLLGIVIAFAYMYLNGNKIVVMQTNDDRYQTKKSYGKQTKDSFKSYPKSKRYNIYNYYYTQGNNQPYKQHFQTDTLPTNGNDKFVKTVNNKSKNIVLDLNSCDSLDLQMISGIGPVFSHRICAYRRKLGGYVSVSQLREVYGMDEKRYQSIERHFVIGSNEVRKLNINSENIKYLASHPYIDYYLAKEIIVFHKNHGAFTDIEQLRAVHLMDDTVFYKLKPYLALD